MIFGKGVVDHKGLLVLHLFFFFIVVTRNKSHGIIFCLLFHVYFLHWNDFKQLAKPDALYIPSSVTHQVRHKKITKSQPDIK